VNTWDFDAAWARQGHGTLKWEALAARFGRADLLPLWVADMEFPTPAFILEALQAELAQRDFGYRLTPSAFAEAVAGWMLARHGWQVHPDWVLAAPGVVPSLGLAVLALSEPGAGVVVQPPVYPPLLSVAAEQGRRCIENPLRRVGMRWEMDFDHLEQCFRAGSRLLLLCHPHNPVGRLWEPETLRRLGALAGRYAVTVVSDEIHADISYGTPFTPFAALAPELAALTVTLNAPGKSFQTAALNTAYIIASDPHLRTRLRQVLQRFHLHTPHPLGVAALVAAYREGAGWIEALNGYLAGNRDLACKTLAAQAPALGVTVPEATYLLWLDFAAYGWDDAQLATTLVQQARLALSPGASFGRGGANHARLNFALPRAQLATAFARLVAVLPK
jgi:cystathionine beta-lyase